MAPHHVLMALHQALWENKNTETQNHSACCLAHCVCSISLERLSIRARAWARARGGGKGVGGSKCHVLGERRGERREGSNLTVIVQRDSVKLTLETTKSSNLGDSIPGFKAGLSAY